MDSNMSRTAVMEKPAYNAKIGETILAKEETVFAAYKIVSLPSGKAIGELLATFDDKGQPVSADVDRKRVFPLWLTVRRGDKIWYVG